MDDTAFQHERLMRLKQTELSKRELFAAMAMQGLCASSSPMVAAVHGNDLIRTAVRCADELLKELAK